MASRLIIALIVAILTNFEAFLLAEQIAAECPIALPQHASEAPVCKQYRATTLFKEKLYYRLGDPSLTEFSYPRLNQSEAVVRTRVAFEEDEAYLATSKQVLKMVGEKVAHHMLRAFGDVQLKTYEQYQFVYRKFIEAIGSLHQKSAAFPSELPGFYHTIPHEKFRLDKEFAQRRLAGLCPFYIKKVTHDGNVGMSSEKLFLLQNQQFDWNAAVSKVYGEETTLEREIDAGRIYVLFHEVYNDIIHLPDIIFNGVNRTRLDSPSTLTLFVIDNKHQFRVVAIQMDYSDESRVFTPDSGEFAWEKAKAFVEMEESGVCQIDGHLFQTHLPMELICNIYPKHLSPTHPLHPLMHQHCVGTSPLGMLGVDNVLLMPGGLIHKLFNFGHIGAVHMVNRLYEHEHYDDLDFMHRLKKDGLDNEHLRYYPYRNDALELWNEVQQFASSFINNYYHNDEDVVKDFELQNFANEISADGKVGSNGGKGKYKGFPASFQTVEQLKVFLTRFVFLPIQHVSANYPLFPYGAYIPMASPKLYVHPDDKKFLDMLPNLPFVLAHTLGNALALGTLRMNTLFDYYDKMADEKARSLVKHTYIHFMTEVQGKLEARNKERFDNGDLTYQYLEPKWLTSSIHV